MNNKNAFFDAILDLANEKKREINEAYSENAKPILSTTQKTLLPTAQLLSGMNTLGSSLVGSIDKNQVQANQIIQGQETSGIPEFAGNFGLGLLTFGVSSKVAETALKAVDSFALKEMSKIGIDSTINSVPLSLEPTDDEKDVKINPKTLAQNEVMMTGMALPFVGKDIIFKDKQTGAKLTNAGSKDKNKLSINGVKNIFNNLKQKSKEKRENVFGEKQKNKNMVDFVNNEAKYIDTEPTPEENTELIKGMKLFSKFGDKDSLQEQLSDIFDNNIKIKEAEKTDYKDGTLYLNKNDNIDNILKILDSKITKEKENKVYKQYTDNISTANEAINKVNNNIEPTDEIDNLYSKSDLLQQDIKNIDDRTFLSQLGSDKEKETATTVLNKYKNLSKDDLDNAYDIIKSAKENPELLKDSDFKHHFIKASDILNTVEMIHEPRTIKSLNNKLKGARKAGTIDRDMLKEQDPFTGDIYSQVLEKDFPYMDEKDKSFIASLDRGENKVEPKISKTQIKKDFRQQIKNIFKGKLSKDNFIYGQEAKYKDEKVKELFTDKKIKDTLETKQETTIRDRIKAEVEKKYRKHLENKIEKKIKEKKLKLSKDEKELLIKKQLKDKQKLINNVSKKYEKDIYDSIIDEFNTKPTEFAKFKVEPDGYVKIDSINVNEIEKRIKYIAENNKKADEKFNSYLSLVEAKSDLGKKEFVNDTKKRVYLKRDKDKAEARKFVETKMRDIYKKTLKAFKKGGSKVEKFKKETGIETEKNFFDIFKKLGEQLKEGKISLLEVTDKTKDGNYKINYNKLKNKLMELNGVKKIKLPDEDLKKELVTKLSLKEKLKLLRHDIKKTAKKKPTELSDRAIDLIISKNLDTEQKIKDYFKKYLKIDEPNKETVDKILKLIDDEHNKNFYNLGLDKYIEKTKKWKEFKKENEYIYKRKNKKESKTTKEKDAKTDKKEDDHNETNKIENDKSYEQKLKDKSNEYINKVYNDKTINNKRVINKLKEAYSKLEDKVHYALLKRYKNIKYNEYISYDNLVDALNKYGTTDMKKLTEVAGGSDELHMLSLIHETLHNIDSYASEKKIINYSSIIMDKLLKDFPELKQRWNISSEFEKFLKKQNSKIKLNDMEKKEVWYFYNDFLGMVYSNKSLRDIMLGSQSVWNKVITINKIVSDELDRAITKILKNETVSNTLKKIDKYVPVKVKHILFESNLLEPTEYVKNLTQLKERMKTAYNIYLKASQESVKQLRGKYTTKQLNVIIDSGIHNIAFFTDKNVKDLLKEINKLKLSIEEKQFLNANIDFRYIDDTAKIKDKILNKRSFEQNQQAKKLFGSYENYLLSRAKFIIDDIHKTSFEHTEELDNFISLYKENAKDVIDKETMIVDYKPYIVKTLNMLTLAKDSKERKELLNKGYKEVEPYMFIVPNNEIRTTSSFMFMENINHKTGLVLDFNNLESLKNYVNQTEIKNYTIEYVNNKIRLRAFPKKETFNKIYVKSEPTEILNTMLGSIIEKDLNEKLKKSTEFKENLKHILSTNKEDGYVKLGDVSAKIIKHIFKDDKELSKQKDIYIKKEYKDMFMYKHFHFDNEKLNTIYNVYTGLIKRLKGNLTYKSPPAHMSAIMNGITGLTSLGVNPKYIPKLVSQTYKEYRNWLKFEKKFNEIFIKEGYSKAREYLKTIKKSNVFAEIYYDGKIGSLEPTDSILFGSTNDEKALFTYLRKLDDKFGTNNAEKAMKLIKTGMLDKETIVGSYLVNFYSNIDLFSRASAYKYLKENIGKEKAIEEINNIFVDFKKEPIGWITDLENSGTPFLTFMIRMQGGILKTAKNNPVTVAGLIGLYYAIENNYDDDYAKNGIRIDSWFLHRTFGDALVFKLSIMNQIYNGNFDKVLENTLIPRVYLKAYGTLFNDKPVENVLGITYNKRYDQTK